MALPSPAKTAGYRKVLIIGTFLFLFQVAILVWVIFSRALGVDTFHGFQDVLAIAGTYYLYRNRWASSEAFERNERRWLLFGVWSLAIGGIIVGVEAAHHLYVLHAISEVSPPPTWPLLLVALFGALGNWRMHSELDAISGHEHDALHKNNLDHVFWDMVLSGAVFVSGCLTWLFGTMAIDSWIAIVVGFIVLPYFAWKRWKDGGHKHHHHD